jgi:hypothetical protein
MEFKRCLDALHVDPAHKVRRVTLNRDACHCQRPSQRSKCCKVSPPRRAVPTHGTQHPLRRKADSKGTFKHPTPETANVAIASCGKCGDMMLPASVLRLVRSEFRRIRFQRRIGAGKFCSAPSARFVEYRDSDAGKKIEFKHCLDALHINPAGKRVLDLGPGYSSFMDLCMELGAVSCDFCEIDPEFFEHNRKRGYGAFAKSLLTQVGRLTPTHL